MHHANLQGILVYAYAQASGARYLHVALPDGAPARAWLAGLRREVSSSAAFRDMPREAREHATFTNVAFTATGLGRLGIEPDELSGFARELQQGMAHPERSRVLGDLYDDAPENWQFGGPRNPRIDALVMLFARGEALEAAVARERERARVAGASIVLEQPAWLDEIGREHFGFRDGIAQPHVAGSERRRMPGQQTMATGELLLGHPNAYSVTPPTPRARSRAGSPLAPDADGRVDIGRDGTYLVYRKLEQDVHGFWKAACAHAGPSSPSTRRHAAIQLAARMV
jgi:deferrochelatase/peroxidase EfeB